MKSSSNNSSSNRTAQTAPIAGSAFHFLNGSFCLSEGSHFLNGSPAAQKLLASALFLCVAGARYKHGLDLALSREKAAWAKLLADHNATIAEKRAVEDFVRAKAMADYTAALAAAAPADTLAAAFAAAQAERGFVRAKALADHTAGLAAATTSTAGVDSGEG
ncbi:hypothetical protein BBAD15_g10240 [Beauveria bassiana D1-5]|uniref:Uncharacterized protein n=1 Tax=Beauveria bassiana D1-5 TaxID=1245745 RepID=A0A0A2VUP8_BEABA|nr:hypothetical protein BBAD15_g10240 [Beauveria bassiana D1-5]